jgi:hypothetical protein
MTSKRIQRSATVEGNQVTIDKPAFITLVKKPANQRSFGILRSEEDNVSKPNTKRVGRTRRSAAPSADLVRLSLPATLDEAAVTATLANYGLSTFEVSRADEAGEWVAQNPDAIDCTDLVSMALTDGVTAFVKRNEDLATTSAKNQLTVTSFEFDAEILPDAAAVAEWCTRNSVDFDEKALNNPSGMFVLQRAEAGEGEEVRRMELEEGVVVNVIRSCDCNIPDGFIAVINEYAYGGWGWGQLDFNASLADTEVGDKLWQGLYILEDLYRNILFWSELPIDVKKELVTRAGAQFSTYVNGLLDTLPRELLLSVATTQRSAKEKNEMTTTATKPASQDTKRTEDAPAPAPVAVVGSPEFTNAVAEAVAAALVQRDEKAAADEAARVQREADEKKAQEDEEAKSTVRRQELADAIALANKPLLDEIAALKGTTVLRSESTDLKQGSAPVKRGTGDLFKGCLGIQRGVQERAPEAEGDE